MTIEYEPTTHDWLCYCTNEEVEKLFIFLELFNYKIWYGFKLDRHMRSENQVVYEVDHAQASVCRITNYDNPRGMVFDNVDALIKYHLEDSHEKD